MENKADEKERTKERNRDKERREREQREVEETKKERAGRGSNATTPAPSVLGGKDDMAATDAARVSSLCTISTRQNHCEHM